ncbi:MAG: hypothetical protein E7552_02635 [Ruminococcaceae bacterium]|nr:hypothetical protein [Oscillospiraceae bacterium]
MAILRVRDNKGNVVSIPAIKGDQGDKGAAGAGVHIGSYAGDGQAGSRYFDLGSPNVRAVLLAADDNDVFPPTVVTSNGAFRNGKKIAWLVDAYGNGTVDLSVMYDANADGVTYHYIAFVEEESR